jgi:hypothetical protein
MEQDRIIIVMSPTEVMQKVFVFSKGQVVEQVPVPTMEISAVLNSIINKYNITDVHFTGAQAYSRKFGDQIQEDCITKYNKTITVSYS